jgi:hypothetical protein
MALEFELRDLRMLGGALPLFALVIFQIGPHAFCLEMALDCDPPTSTSCVAGKTGTNYQTQFVLDLLNFL